MFYIRAILFQEWANPYDLDRLIFASRELGLSGDDHPFLYHQLTLYGFQLLAWLPFHVSALIWLAMLCMCLVIIGDIRRADSAVFILIATGLNGTVVASLRALQISIPLMFLILLGALLVSRNRYGPAALPKALARPVIRFDGCENVVEGADLGGGCFRVFRAGLFQTDPLP